MSDLFQRARDGDARAQTEIHGIIRRIARAVCRDGGPGGADVNWEDVSQEASRRILTVGIHQFRGSGSLEGYIYAVVRSTVLQAVRAASRRRNREKFFTREPVHDSRDHDTRLDVRGILARLPAECAWLLDQVFLRGVPYRDLAAEMAMLESSVRVKVSRCLKRAMQIAESGAA